MACARLRNQNLGGFWSFQAAGRAGGLNIGCPVTHVGPLECRLRHKHSHLRHLDAAYLPGSSARVDFGATHNPKVLYTDRCYYRLGFFGVVVLPAWQPSNTGRQKGRSDLPSLVGPSFFSYRVLAVEKHVG